MSLLFFALPIVFQLIEVAHGQSWTQLPGKAVQISAKGKYMWAVDDKMFVAQWNGSTWVHKGHANWVSAGKDGSAWIVQTYPQRKVYRLNTENTAWQPLNEWFTTINAIDYHSAVGVNMYTHLYRFNDATATYMKFFATDIAIGDGNEIWAVTFSGEIYRYEDDKWASKPGMAVSIDVQNATRVVITDQNQNVYLWTGIDWKLLGGHPCLRATINYKSVICVDPNNAIFTVDVEDPKPESQN